MNAVTTKYNLAPTTTSWNTYGTSLNTVTTSAKGTRKATEAMIESVNRADQAKLGNLKNEIDGVKFSAQAAAAELRRMTQYALGAASAGAGGGGGGSQAPTGGGGGGGGAKPSLTGLQEIKKTLRQEATKTKQFAKLTGKLGFSEGLAGMILGGKNPIKTAKAIIQGTKKAANKLKNMYAKSAAGIAEANQAANGLIVDSNEEVLDSIEETVDPEIAILAEKERVYNSFLDSVKQTFSAIKDSIMGAFSLPELGTSTSGIIRNMEKMLVKVRAFAKNVAQLSTMGLDPALLNQVISAGPIAGSQLAAGLVAGGVEALSTINAGYAEIGALSSAIATTGTEAAFSTAAQQSIYNINVDGGVGSGSTIGKAIVDAIKAYERTSGAVWQGA